MLVVIGKDLINPHQIATVYEGRLPEDHGSKKYIRFDMSNDKSYSYTAGKEGYSDACALRDKMLKDFVVSLSPEKRS